MKENEGMGEGYHPLYNIIIFPIFAYLYFNDLEMVTLSSIIATFLIWKTIAVVFDLFGWGIIKHPWHYLLKNFIYITNYWSFRQ